MAELRFNPRRSFPDSLKILYRIHSLAEIVECELKEAHLVEDSKTFIFEGPEKKLTWVQQQLANESIRLIGTLTTDKELKEKAKQQKNEKEPKS